MYTGNISPVPPSGNPTGSSPKPKLNLTIREESRQKLERIAQLENRSVSNLIEQMADERWDRLAEVEGFPFVKLITDLADKAKINIRNPDELRRFRRAVLDELLKTRPS